MIYNIYHISRKLKNQCPTYDAISFISRTHAPKNLEVEMEAAPLTMTCSNPLGKIFFPVLTILCFAGLGVFVSMEEMLPSGDTA